MIVFTPIKDFPIELLEAKRISQVIKFNLTSYYADAPTLNYLVPSIEHIPEDVLNGDCTSPIFDVAYHQYIMNNDLAFFQFMSIISAEFTMPEALVQIEIEVSEYRNAIAESLIKLIQQRYGVNAYYVFTLEDFMNIDMQDFSIPGLFAYDQDAAKWRFMNPNLAGEFYE